VKSISGRIIGPATVCEIATASVPGLMAAAQQIPGAAASTPPFRDRSRLKVLERSRIAGRRLAQLARALPGGSKRRDLVEQAAAPCGFAVLAISIIVRTFATVC
jgi:hypothetical protein